MTKLYTETLGEGKTIVMVHGWAMHGGIWRNFAEALAKEFRVVTVDLPGHGFSPPVVPFSLETVAASLAESITEAPCCWLGWSLGAEIVVYLASRFPGRVDRTILLAGTPCFVRNGGWPGVRADILEGFAENLKQDSQDTLLKFLSLQIKGEANPKQALLNLKQSIFERPAPDIRTLMQGLDVLKHADLRPELADLAVPVAAILGELDTLVPVSAGEQMRKLVPALDLTIIPRAGHAPFLSHSEELVAAVKRIMEMTFAG